MFVCVLSCGVCVCLILCLFCVFGCVVALTNKDYYYCKVFNKETKYNTVHITDHCNESVL